MGSAGEPGGAAFPDLKFIGEVRPSRRPLRGLLRMTSFLNNIINLPHPEEARSAVSKDARGGQLIFSASQLSPAMLRRSRSRLASGQISASLYIVSKAGIPAGSWNQGDLLRVKM